MIYIIKTQPSTHNHIFFCAITNVL